MAVTVHAAQHDALELPNRLDRDQTLRASKALLTHLHNQKQRSKEPTSKKNLLASENSDEEEETAEGAGPIWLNLTTKKQIVDKVKLKPSKIPVPNSLNSADDLDICLITTDPQRAVKNAIADPTFPTSLSSRITRIIGFTKLQSRYKSFEQKRQLLSEHDIFLADERIITRLPQLLGKVFYKGTAKRPIPIDLMPHEKGDENAVKQNKKTPKEERRAEVATPLEVAKEIEKALCSVPVSLSPSHQISVRVGLPSLSPEQLAENITAVVSGIIEKHVASKWKNVKGIHIKSPTSFAIPIWLADELWSEKAQIVENPATMEEQIETSANSKSEENVKRKRKLLNNQENEVSDRKKTRRAEAKALEKEESTSRKQKLSAQKAQAFKGNS